MTDYNLGKVVGENGRGIDHIEVEGSTMNIYYDDNTIEEIEFDFEIDPDNFDLEDYIQFSDIVDDLETDDSEKPLSAAQGKELKDLIDDIEITGDYENLTNKPNLAAVALSGSYNDLTDKPTINSGEIDPSNLDLDDYVQFSDIVDDLETDDSEKPLSAKQGKWLNDNKSASNHTHSGYAASNHTHSGYAASNHTHSQYVNPTIVDNLESDSSTSVLSAKQGKILNQNKANSSDIANTYATIEYVNGLAIDPSSMELEGYVKTADIVDGLGSNDGTKVLSAKQGKALKDIIDAKDALFTQFQQNLGDLDDDLTDLKNDVTELDGDLDDLKDDVTELDGNLTTLDGNLTTLDGNLDTLDGSLDTLKTNLTNFNKALIQFNDGNVELASDLSTLQGNLNTFLLKITSLDTTLTNTSSSLTNVDNELTELVSDLGIFSEYLTNFEGDINALENKLKQELGTAGYNKLNEDLVALFGAITKLRSRATSTEGAIDEAQENIEEAQGEITEVKTEMIGNGTFENPQSGSLIDTVNNTSDSVETVIENTEDLQDIMYGDGTVEEPAQDSLMYNVNENIENIDVVQGDIQTVQGDIETVQGNIETVQGDIEEVQGDIEVVQGDIEEVQGDIDDVQTALDNIISHQIEVLPSGQGLSSTQYNYTVGDSIAILVRVFKGGSIYMDLSKEELPLNILKGDNTSQTIQYTTRANPNYIQYYLFDYTLTTSGLHVISCGEAKVTIYVKSAWVLDSSSTVSGIKYYMYVNQETRTCLLYVTGSKTLATNGDNNIAVLPNTTQKYPPSVKIETTDSNNQTVWIPMTLVTAVGTGGVSIRITYDGKLIANKYVTSTGSMDAGITGSFMWNY